MAEIAETTADRDWGLAQSVVMGVAILGFAITWGLVITASPDGFISPFGIVISFLAGAYLLFLVYSYLRG